MRSEDLDRAIGETPQSFVNRMEQTLAHLPQAKTRTVWHIPCRRVIALAVFAILLCGTAVAIGNQGLAWYYSHRFAAYQTYEPEKYNAIMSHLTADVSQTAMEDADIQAGVTEVSWTPESGLLIVSVCAETRFPDTTELHPMWNLDADGAYVDLEEGVEDEEGEGHSVHFLWANGTYGPVEEMIAPGKELLLIDCDTILLGEKRLWNYSMDAFVDEESRVQFILEFQLPEEQQRMLQEAADSNGVVTLTVCYTLTHYTDDDEQLYMGGREGRIMFQLSVK